MTKGEQIKNLKKRLRQIQKESRNWEDCANSWMKSYDEIVAKFCPKYPTFNELNEFQDIRNLKK